MSICSVSSRLLLHDTNTWDLNNSYGSCDGLLRGVCWSDDGTYILQVNSEGMVEVLMATDHDLQSEQRILVKDSWSATFQREGYRDVAIGTKNGNIIIWDTKNKCIMKTFPTPSQQSCVNFVSYNSINTNLAASFQNGDTIIYELMSNIPIQTVELPYSKSIKAMKFHHDARSILGLATDEGHVTLQNILENKEVFFSNSHYGPVSDIAYSLTSHDLMFSCGCDKITNVYDMRSKSIVSAIETQHVPTSLDINHENQLALGTKEGLILVYDLRNLTTMCKLLKGHEQEVTGVSFQHRRKTTLAVDVNLQADAEIVLSSPKRSSPIRNRNSHVFRISDDLPSIFLRPPPEGKAEVSCLELIDLDKSFNSSDEGSSFFQSESKDKLSRSGRFSLLDVEKNNCDESTPKASELNVNITIPSPLLLTGMPDNERPLNADVPFVDFRQNGISTIDAKVMKDLKINVADLASDNIHYYLSIMMFLTKQKLYLEKTLTAMNQEIDELIQINSTIITENIRLTLIIHQLKSKHNLFS